MSTAYCSHCRRALPEDPDLLVHNFIYGLDGTLDYIELAHIWCAPEWASPIRRFAYLCYSHDMSFEYSDDPRWWRAGRSELEAIKKLAAEINRPHVTRAIWNDAVREKFSIPANFLDKI